MAKVTVYYLVDGLVQRDRHKGKRRDVSVHIHDDAGPVKRGYVRVRGVQHLYGGVVKIVAKGL